MLLISHPISECAAMSQHRIISRLALALLSIAMLPAHAHRPDNEMLRLSLADDTVRLMTSIEGRQLLEFDIDRDGALSRLEFDTQFDDIAAWVDRHISVVGADSHEAEVVFTDMPVPDHSQLSDGDPVTHVRIIRNYRVGAGKMVPIVRFDLFDRSHAVAYRNYQVHTGDGSKVGAITSLNNTIELRMADSSAML